MVEHLPSMHKVLSLILNTTKTGTKVAICHPSIWEVDTEGSEAQGHPQQVSRVSASPGCRRLITERCMAVALGLMTSIPHKCQAATPF